VAFDGQRVPVQIYEACLIEEMMIAPALAVGRQVASVVMQHVGRRRREIVPTAAAPVLEVVGRLGPWILRRPVTMTDIWLCVGSR